MGGDEGIHVACEKNGGQQVFREQEFGLWPVD
jgi:hypothetical protein